MPKLSELPAVTALLGDNDVSPVVASGTTAKLTVSQQVANHYARGAGAGLLTMGGTAAALTGTLPFTLDALVNGSIHQFKAPTTMAASGATLNVNGLGAKPLTKFNGQPVTAGDLSKGGQHFAIYDGPNDRLELIAGPQEGFINGARFGLVSNGTAAQYTDNSDVLQAIYDAAGAAGLTALLPPGNYGLSKEVLVNTPYLVVQGAGIDKTVLIARDPADLIGGPGARTAGDQRYIKTRIAYRADAAAAQDAALSSLINIQQPGVQHSYMTLRCHFDPANTSPTHYGALWDTAFFVGCRPDVSFLHVKVRGYWREACIWADVTRLSGSNEYTIPSIAGVTKPGQLYADSQGALIDGFNISHCDLQGGKWGLRVQGPIYSAGTFYPGWKLALHGFAEFSGQPTTGDTLTLNSVAITFRTTPTSPSTEVQIGATLTETLANLLEWLEDDARPFSIRRADYTHDTAASRVFVLQNDEGTLLGSYTLAESSANITVSAATVAVTPDPALYYNQTSGTAITDNRGAGGGSDFLVLASALYGTEHHTNRRRNDIAATPNVNTDPAGGAMMIDGGCNNGYARIHNHTFVRCRFASFEPFLVRLLRTARDTFIACHFEHRQGPSRLTTAAVSLPSGKDVTKFYGPIAMGTGGNRPLKTKLISCDQTPYSEYFTLLDDGSIANNSKGDSFCRRLEARDRVTTNLVKGNDLADLEIQAGNGHSTRIRTQGNETAFFMTSSNINFSKPLVPGTTGTLDLGSTSINVRNVYLQNAPIVASDAKLKEELPRAALGLDFLLALRPVCYKMVDRIVPGEDVEGNPIEVELTFSGRAHEGFIAQEVKALLDTLELDSAIWCESPDGGQSLRYEELIPVLTKAVQQQQTLIEALTARIAALES